MWRGVNKLSENFNNKTENIKRMNESWKLQKLKLEKYIPEGINNEFEYAKEWSVIWKKVMGNTQSEQQQQKIFKWEYIKGSFAVPQVKRQKTYLNK